jgi:hypothetical protein
VVLLAGVLIVFLAHGGGGGSGNDTARDNSQLKPAGLGGQPPAASKLTEENFGKLKLNMTKPEVRALLGSEQDEMPGGAGLSWQEGGNLISVHFQNDRVMMVTAFINGKRLAIFPNP